MNKKSSLILNLFLIFIISLLCFTWFESDLIYSFGDFTFNFSPKNNLDLFLYTWNERISTGIPNFWNFSNLIPYQIFLYVWDCLKLPLHLGQRFMLWFLFLASGLSTFYLVLTISKESYEQGEKKLGWAIFSGVFYMMNPFSLVIIWGVLTKQIFFYSFAPLLLALYINFLSSKKKIMYFFLMILTSLLMTPSFSVLTFAVNFWIIIFAYLVYYLLCFNVGKREKLKKILNTFIILLFWLPINAFWLLPCFSYSGVVTQSQSGVLPSKMIIGASRDASLVNTIRLFGYNVFHEKFMNIDVFYPYAETYTSSLFIFLSIIPSIFVLSSILFILRKEKKRENYFILFFGLFFLVSLFFFKGSREPFGAIFTNLADLFPKFFLAYRNPIDKIGPIVVLSFSVLFGYSLTKISTFFSRINKTVFLFSLFLIIFFIYLFPFWRGKVFYKGGEVYRSSLVRVPSYYWEAKKWLDLQKEDFRLFPIPFSGQFGFPLKWEFGHDASNPDNLIFDKPSFFALEVGSPQRKIWSILNKGKEEVTLKDTRELQNLITITQTKYFVLHEDIAIDYFSVNKKAFERVKDFIINDKQLFFLEKQIGELGFYKVKGTAYLPKIFITEEKISSDSASLEKIFKPDIKRINPTKWEVNIQSFKKPFSLIFLSTFDPDWKVFLLPPIQEKVSYFGNIIETLGSKPLSETTHFLAYDYANSWQIENAQNNDLTRLVIEYIPQRFFYLEIAISLIALAILIIAVIVKSIANAKQK